MKAVMLAAGVGTRLYGKGDCPPKALLRFDGRTLLARHVEILRAVGVTELVLVVGHRAADLHEEVDRIGATRFVRTVENAGYRRGSLVSLWTAREALSEGEPVLFMDADVLYHPALVERLVARKGDAIPFDTEFEPGDEPVKLCLRAGTIVEFAKVVDVAHDQVGEWPGFLRLEPETAGHLAEACDRYVRSGQQDEMYERAMRDVMLADPGRFRVEDVTGLPWIEIDFPEDLERAAKEILPRLPA